MKIESALTAFKPKGKKVSKQSAKFSQNQEILY